MNYFQAIYKRNSTDFETTDILKFDAQQIADFTKAGWICVSGNSKKGILNKTRKVLFGEHARFVHEY